MNPNAFPYGKPVEIIKGKHFFILIQSDKLFWIADAKPPQNIENAFFFNIDNVSSYQLTLFKGPHLFALQQRLRTAKSLNDSSVLPRASQAAQRQLISGPD
jgi:hypothetical protein